MQRSSQWLHQERQVAAVAAADHGGGGYRPPDRLTAHVMRGLP